MKNTLPIINLDESTGLWLTEVYEALKQNTRLSERQIWSNLRGRIPKNFNPSLIDERLCFGNSDRISMLGIIAVEKNYSTIEKGDKLIFKLSEYWDKHPEIHEVEIALIAQECQIDPIEAGIILELINQYGTFYRSARLSPAGIALTSIDIGPNSEGYMQYRYFDGLEDLIGNYLKRRQENKRNDDLFFSSNLEVKNQTALVNISPIFTSRISNTNLGICFVLMPFTEEWSDRVYKRLIKENVEKLGLQCLRADNLTGPIIIEDIWTQINQSALIIADVTKKNPNVMYELGIVHTIGKPFILITQNVSERPFDFAHLRHYEYQDNIEGFEKFGADLKKTIKEVYISSYPGSSRFEVS
jgi:hypothetical protein